MQLVDTRFDLNQTVLARFGRYSNGQTVIELMCEDGESWLTATCAIPSSIPAGAVAIKDWSENEGIVAILLTAGVIEGPPLARLPLGFLSVPVYRLSRAAQQASSGVQS